ncbi:hypothetical protein [Proteocatella sphenisci]|uniref:hypothetical protein n=1 Tax=Proteocatella sphenisci TaxID=181070 RepID=UPI00048F3154|nr:hypothetical protein [Proteocatella sphenisci]
MKKYLIFVFICIFCYFSYDYIVYYNGDMYLPNSGEVRSFTKSEDEKLWIDKGNGFEVFDIRGVNLGLGKPGKFATEYAITKEEYLRWFKQIQDLGANVIRTYTIAHEDFYEAFYEYNHNNSEPLYLIHGVWVDDYLLNSHRNAFDDRFYNEFLNSCKNVVDIINGRHKNSKLHHAGSQTYKTDISPWVYGYIIGVEWEGDIVAFTNKTGPQLGQFKGKYLYTENANNFEIFLAMIGDEMIDYETRKYGKQRTLAFSNWPVTDPFEYPENVALEVQKFAQIDMDHIKSSDSFKSGQYASYHIYPYYPEYMYFVDETTENTYLAYLKKLTEHHQMPVVISEFGIPSSRGMASYENNKELGRNQGYMSEKEQGDALVSLYQEIKSSDCAGGIVFVWQDEWFKRTWNTFAFVDLNKSIYWSDYQTNEQTFGLLSFDPGEDKSICYVDGDKSDWQEDDIVDEDEGYRLSMKYDEKFIYLLAEKEGFDPNLDKLYIPLDITPKSGSKYMDKYKIKTSHSTDFMIEIDTENKSRIWVQERYNTTNAIYGSQLIRSYNQYEDIPAKDSAQFDKIKLVLNEFNYFNNGVPITFSMLDFTKGETYYSLSKSYETGKLTYGNANPKADDFNSLADFSFGSDFVEIKIPWQLLNFSDPSQMKIHDDYYEYYGVEHMRIDQINVGLGSDSNTIEMKPFNLVKLGKNPQYHERLKESYYILQDFWSNN